MNGAVVSGELIEKTDEYIKLNVEGVEVTYFMDEVDRQDSAEKAPVKAENDEIMTSVMAMSQFSHAMADSFKQLAADLTAGKHVESSIADFKERTRLQREKLESTKFVKGLEKTRGKILEASDYSDALADAALKNDDASMQQSLLSMKQSLADGIEESVAFCKRENVPEEQMAKIIVALMQKH